MFGQQETKKCRKCGENKPLSCYTKAKESVDGLRHACRFCLGKYAKENRQKNIEREKARSLKWYYNNKDKANEQNKIWCANNKNKRKSHGKKYYERNKESVLIREKIYRENNREKITISNRVSTKKWRDKNKEIMRKMVKDWNEKNPERLKQIQKDWDKKNPDKRAAFRRNANVRRRMQKGMGKISYAEWEKIISNAKHKCHYCKMKLPLTMDHVIPLSKGGLHAPSNVVPACRACNSRKNNKILTLL